MSKSINDIPKSFRVCPVCNSKGKIVRVLNYGINKREEQVKLECTKCINTWKYHTDEK
ncbi:hypothetical protein ACFL6H_07840 [Candidatus Latescibacterota bacterium]